MMKMLVGMATGDGRLVYVLLLVCTLYLPVTQGGICWLMRSTRGRCQRLDEVGVSREQCCESHNVHASWSDHDLDLLPPTQLFYWETLEGGADKCQPCHVNCDNVDCGPHKRCVMRGGRPRCACAPDCEDATRGHQGAVCGMDGRSYRSNCSLSLHNCRFNRDVRVDYTGRCQRSCDKVTCGRGKNCVTDQHALPHCVTCTPLSVCQRARGPLEKVCGADCVTYPSVCYYRRASCLKGRAIGIAYMGECREAATCADVTCGRGQQCLSQPVTNRPKCVTCSQTECPPVELTADGESVSVTCGTDNKNYVSWCEMQAEACRTGVVIETKHTGPCTDDDLPLAEYYDEEASDYNALYHDFV